ncbi:MAG: diguanylate cyclase [Gemmatimonadota bacterium]|nr:MAG: diguanylate cyclase [Gemmatimonadota bacterium]
MDETYRILVVDDEEIIATALGDILTEEGYWVARVGSGREAIQLLQKESFDVVVTDLIMEEGDGLFVIRTLSHLYPETIVIILTGHSSIDTAVEAIRAGAYDYLVKPCNNDYLKATIRRGLEKKRLSQQLHTRTLQLEQSSTELAQKTEQLSTLHEISTNLQGVHDVNELLNHIADGIHARLGFRKMRIGLLSENNRYLRWRKEVDTSGSGGVSPDTKETPVEAICEVMSRSQKFEQSYYVQASDISKYDFSQGTLSAETDAEVICDGWCFDGALLIPLSAESEHEIRMGILVIDASQNGHPPSPGTVKILETFAHTASAALERVQLEKRLRRIYDLSKEMTHTASVNEIISIVVQAMANILRFDHCSVSLLDKKRRVLKTVACLGFPEKELGREFPIDGDIGICAWVARTGRTANVSDVREDPRYVVGAPASKSELAVPVIMKNRVYGVLNVESDRVAAFSDTDVRPLVALASQTAVAMEHTRLEEKLSALYGLNQEMSLAMSLDDVLEMVLDGAQEILEFDHYALMFIDDEKNELYVKKFRGFQKNIECLRLRLNEGRGITTIVANTGEPIYVPDVTQDRRYVPGWRGTRSELAVPLKIREKVIGVFNVESCEKAAFDDNDYKLFVTLSAQTAAAIEDIKLLEEIQQTKNFLKNLVDSSVDAIITTDVRGKITFFSKGAESIFGYSSQEAIQQPVSKYFVHGKSEAKNIMAMLYDNGKIQNLETEFYTKDGRILSVSLSAALLKNEQGEMVGTVGISKDITEVKKLEKNMKETKNYLENLIEHSQDALYAIDLDGNITMWNSGAEYLYGYTKEEVLGTCGDDLLDPKDHKRKTNDIIEKVRAFGRLVDEEVFRVRKDGKAIPVTATFSPILDAEGAITGISVIDKDLSLRKRLETALRKSNARLKDLSLTDDLTLLYNRRYLNQKLEEEIKRSKRFDRPLAFVMIDIDHFKNYNDSYGHPKGDEILKELARIIVDNCRDVDLVARYGGEEFSILLPETTPLEAFQQAERIRTLIEDHNFEGEELQPDGRLTVSLGIAIYPNDAKTKHEIVEFADRALYWAKESGRNRVKHFSHLECATAQFHSIGQSACGNES